MKLEENIMKIILEMVAKKAAEKDLSEEQIQNLIDTAIKAATTDGLTNPSEKATIGCACRLEMI